MLKKMQIIDAFVLELKDTIVNEHVAVVFAKLSITVSIRIRKTSSNSEKNLKIKNNKKIIKNAKVEQDKDGAPVDRKPPRPD
jgi:hypothetical protein